MRRRVASQRGFVAAEFLGAAVAGGFLAYVGAQGFFLGGAIDARARSESAARELSARSAADACAAIDISAMANPKSLERFIPRAELEISAQAPDVGALLTAVLGLNPEAGARDIIPVIFQAPMFTANLSLSTPFSTEHGANMFGRPGGVFVGVASRGVPCVQAKLPTDAELSKMLSKAFFDQMPFGKPF